MDEDVVNMAERTPTRPPQVTAESQPRPEVDAHLRRQVGPSFVLIRDDVHPAITSLARLMEQLADSQSALSESVHHLPDQLKERAEFTGLITSIANIRDAADRLARDIAVQEIQDGKLSRIEAAEMLRVHQGTISRWVRAAKATPAPAAAPTDDDQADYYDSLTPPNVDIPRRMRHK